MKPISIANDIVPIGEFKTRVAQWFKNLQSSGRPLIITQNGKPSAVLLSPADYDELVYRKSLLDSVERGMADMAADKSYRTEELLVALAERRNKS
jgi:antitoxin YefM